MTTETIADRARRLTRECRTRHAVMVDRETQPARHYIITADDLDRGIADGYLFDDEICEIYDVV